MDLSALTNRLSRLAGTDVPAHLRDQHLTQMAAAETASAAAQPDKRFGRVAVAAAAAVGFFAGSTGLAMAGALPEPAQGVAHEVLAVVQIDVPDGKDGKRGPCVSEIASDPDDEYADLTNEEKKALKDECPRNPHDDGDDTNDGPGKSKDAPGHREGGPGNSQHAPGKSDDPPGNSDEAPRGKPENPGPPPGTPAQPGG